MNLSILFALPRELIILIITEWLSLFEITKFDSSLCDIRYRNELKGLYKSNDVIFSGYIYNYNKNYWTTTSWKNQHIYYKYIQINQIKIKNLVLNDKILTSNLSNNCLNIQLNTKLLYINLKNCKLVSDELVIIISKECINLKEIDLWNCNNITDVSLISISCNCEELTCLNIGICKLVTNHGVCSIIKNCMNLNELYLYKCFNITDETINNINQYCNKKLTKLSIGYCNKITNDSLNILAQNCINIKEIYLCDCPDINQEVVLKLVKNCKKLSVFHVPLHLQSIIRTIKSIKFSIAISCH
jgi:hypothetical protein